MSYKALLSVIAAGLLCISVSGCQNNQAENSSTETASQIAASETIEDTSSDNKDVSEATIAGVPVDTPVIDVGETDSQNNSETAPQQTDTPISDDDIVLISDTDADGNLIEPAPPETQEIQNTSEYNYDEFGNVDID